MLAAVHWYASGAKACDKRGTGPVGMRWRSPTEPDGKSHERHHRHQENHPLPPHDRRVARRWLWRRIWARRWERDLTITLALVGLGLSAALLVVSLKPAAQPVGDAVQNFTARMIAARN
jgi:hypothetical protein